ncbi:Hypothetical predicted protein [Octopus vulgaris]|uniref:Uncharacterized protein n=1 Tax=Octopus vulgaris TaxID=6645 RepID=A0AA36FAI5_OCTVU|nr:Hypothetical predicted protein [Octopus vulgaris]
MTLKDTAVKHSDGHVNETSFEYQNSDSKVQQNATTVVEDTQSETMEESSMFVNLLAIFKSPYLRKVTIVVSIEWAVNTTAWNSIFQMLEVLAGNIYLNSFIMSLFDVFAIGIYSVLARRSIGSGFATTFTRIVCLASPFLKLLDLFIYLSQFHVTSVFCKKPMDIESIRWLFANSKVKAAEKIIKHAAKQNKVDFDNIWSMTSENTSQEVDGHMKETSLVCRNGNSKVQQDVATVVQHKQLQTEKESSLPVKLLAIFKSPYLRKVTIVVSIERSVGSGFVTTFTRLACMASPFLKLVALATPWAPGIIIGTGCIFSSILLQILLPETGNRVLPQTIEDVNMMQKKKKKNMKIETIS